MSQVKNTEGVAFAISDLFFAMAWSRYRGISLGVFTDHVQAEEVIEIGTLKTAKPAARWLLWRDQFGGLHFDDWQTGKMDIPCKRVADALRHIDAIISAERSN